MIGLSFPSLQATICVAIVTLCAASAAIPAHAVPPEIPCDYSCAWPIGSYSISEYDEVGKEFVISYTYAWKEIPDNDEIGTLEGKDLPPGRYGALDDLRNMSRPNGYVGSTVTLTLPEGIGVVDWEDKGFEMTILWTDANGHKTYEYTRLNAYSPDAASDDITLELLSDIKYSNAEVVVDLGVRDDDASMPLHLFANQYGTSVVIGSLVELASGAVGSPGRFTSVLPESAMSAGGRGAPDVSGSAGTPGMAYVYGYLNAVGRGGTVAPVADVMVCLHDEGSDGMTAAMPLQHNGQNVCGRTASEGFYGLTVPTADTDGMGTADIVVRFSLVDDDVATVKREGAVPNLELPTRNDVTGPLFSMGTATIPQNDPFRLALAPYADVHVAHQFFEDEVGYTLGHVQISLGGVGLPGIYSDDPPTISLTSSSISLYQQYVTIHEYGHHVEADVYGALPIIPPYDVGHGYAIRTNDAAAWAEGWADFIPSIILDTQILPGLGVYYHVRLETRDSPELAYTELAYPLYSLHRTVGSDVEGSVTSALWDLSDPASTAVGETDDTVSSFDMVWRTFTSITGLEATSPAPTIYDFRDDWHENGFTGIDAILAINGIDPPTPSSLSSLTVEAQNSAGAAKSGAGRLHVKAGDKISVSLELLQANVGAAPTIVFAGGAVNTMTAVGDSGKSWAYAHTVVASSPNGPARFAIVDAGTTGTVSFSESAITAGENVTIDVKPPAALAARFTASNIISLTFDEPLDAKSAAPAQFLVTPPSGAQFPVTGLYDNAQSTIRLTLPAHAVAGSTYTVRIPAIADIVGNVHTESSVMAMLGTDITPPTFTAAYTNYFTSSPITVTFSEDVRHVRGYLPDRANWTFMDPSTGRSHNPRSISANIDADNQFFIRFSSPRFVEGTLTYSPPAGISAIEDTAGNVLSAPSSTTVNGVPSLLAAVGEMNAGTVIVRFTSPLTGTTNASEWKIGGVPATGISTSSSGYEPEPVTDDVTVTSLSSIRIGHAAPAESQGRHLEYTKPTAQDGETANALSTGSGRVLPSFSARILDNVSPQFTSAAFTGPTTISLTSSEALSPASILASTFEAEGLGELIPAYVTGSATVTLTSTVAAAANTPYTITIPRTATDTSGHEFENLEVVLSRSDVTPPVVLSAYVASAPDSVVLELSEPLRPDTVTAEAFGVTADGSTESSLSESDAVSYEPLSRFAHLRLAAAPADDTTYTISIAASKVRDVAGNFLPAGTQAVTYRPAPASSAAFDDQNTIVVTLGSPIIPHRIVEATFSTAPDLGQVSASYAEGSTELRLTTERDASGGTKYRFGADYTLRDVRNSVVSFPRVTYTDTHAPEPVSATSISPTMTEVTFGEPVALGAGATPAQLGAHWTVHDGTDRPVSGVAVKPGEPSVLVLTHAELSGTASTPTVTYSADDDDAGRVRDMGATPNVQGGGPFPVTATDAIPPTASAITLSASKPGPSRTDNEYVRVGDMIEVGLMLGESAGAPPRMAVYGDAEDMVFTEGADRARWSTAYTVPEGAAQGAVEFVIVARDVGGIESVIESTVGRTAVTGGAAIIDTLRPEFSASVLGPTETLVSFTEPVSGTIRASDWTVGGERATGAAAGQGDEASETLAIPASAGADMRQSFVLVHAPLAGTAGTTSVAYSPI